MNDTHMKHAKAMTGLVIGIVVLAGIATLLGIFSHAGPKLHEYVSQHGTSILMYGFGIYQWMPADVAIQSVSQDFITGLLAIPLLLLSLWQARKGCVRAAYVIAGISGYFFITYLVFLMMAPYTSLFLLYTALLSMSFFALLLSLSNLLTIHKISHFPSPKQMKWAGGFLILFSIVITVFWLEIIVPPVLDGSIYPYELFHLTTLVVQGLDLAIFLPIGIIIGFLAWKGRASAYPYLTIYLIFLTVFLLATCSKIFFMHLSGETFVVAAFIIPVACIISGIFSVRILRNMKKALDPVTPQESP